MASSADPAEWARDTYRYLRWLMALLPLVLFLVTVVTAVQQRELEPSISAYYGGPVRDVFVGVLVGTAACMVAYRGTSLVEDYTLNGAGFYALFVALVPTDLADTLAELRSSRTPDGVTAEDYVQSLQTSLTIVVGLCVVLVVVELRNARRLRRLWDSGPWTKAFVAVTSGTLAAFLLLALWQLWVPSVDEVTMDGIGGIPVVGRLRIHDLAAIFLILALAVAVWSHAWPRAALGDEVTDTDLRVAGRYRVIFAAMVAGLPAAVGFHAWVSDDHTVIFLEWWEILLFVAFWVSETRRVSAGGREPVATGPVGRGGGIRTRG